MDLLSKLLNEGTFANAASPILKSDTDEKIYRASQSNLYSEEYFIGEQASAKQQNQKDISRQVSDEIIGAHPLSTKDLEWIDETVYKKNIKNEAKLKSQASKPSFQRRVHFCKDQLVTEYQIREEVDRKPLEVKRQPKREREPIGEAISHEIGLYWDLPELNSSLLKDLNKDSLKHLYIVYSKAKNILETHRKNKQNKAGFAEVNSALFNTKDAIEEAYKQLP